MLYICAAKIRQDFCGIYNHNHKSTQKVAPLIMKAAILLIFSHLLLLNFSSCTTGEGKSADEIQLLGKAVNNKKTITNKSPKDISMKEKLHGIWQSNHEPSAMQFFEDGSFRQYIPEGFTEPDSPEEEFDSGSWTIENGHLILKSDNGKKHNIQISWVEEKLIYFGNIEEEYDSAYGSKIEFAEEMGFSKIED